MPERGSGSLRVRCVQQQNRKKTLLLGNLEAHMPNLLQESPKPTDTRVFFSKDVTVSQQMFGIKGCGVTYCKTKHSRFSCPSLLHSARHTDLRSTKALLKTKAAQKNNSSLGTLGVKPQ